jgi:hypothetical protein
MMIRYLAAVFLILVPQLTSAPAQSPPGKAAQLKPQSPAIEKDKAIRLPDSDILWYDIRELVIEGRGWQDTEEFYDRLPARAKGLVRDPVWELSQNSTGICARFATDAAAIKVRWSLRDEQLGLEHMPATGVSGLDLYIRTEDGGWGWLAVGRPSKYPTNQKDLVSRTHQAHLFLRYLHRARGMRFATGHGSHCHPRQAAGLAGHQPRFFRKRAHGTRTGALDGRARSVALRN